MNLRRKALDMARTAGGRLGAPVLAAWAATIRREVRGWEAVAAARADGPLIIAFWHARFLLLPFIYPHDRPVGVLISPSADGDLIAAIIEGLGRRTIRGSARQGGAAAYRQLRRRLDEGWDVGIATDGPQGPAYRVKAGAIRLAQATGRPLVPLVYTTRRGRALGSWDRFWLPAPGSRGLFLWGAPTIVAREADPEAARRDLEARMRGMLVDAEAWAGRDLAWPA